MNGAKSPLAEAAAIRPMIWPDILSADLDLPPGFAQLTKRKELLLRGQVHYSSGLTAITFQVSAREHCLRRLLAGGLNTARATNAYRSLRSIKAVIQSERSRWYRYRCSVQALRFTLIHLLRDPSASTKILASITTRHYARRMKLFSGWFFVAVMAVFACLTATGCLSCTASVERDTDTRIVGQPAPPVVGQPAPARG